MPRRISLGKIKAAAYSALALVYFGGEVLTALMLDVVYNALSQAGVNALDNEWSELSSTFGANTSRIVEQACFSLSNNGTASDIDLRLENNFPFISHILDMSSFALSAAIVNHDRDSEINTTLSLTYVLLMLVFLSIEYSVIVGCQISDGGREFGTMISFLFAVALGVPNLALTFSSDPNTFELNGAYWRFFDLCENVTRTGLGYYHTDLLGLDSDNISPSFIGGMIFLIHMVLSITFMYSNRFIFDYTPEITEEEAALLGAEQGRQARPLAAIAAAATDHSTETRGQFPAARPAAQSVSAPALTYEEKVEKIRMVKPTFLDESTEENKIFVCPINLTLMFDPVIINGVGTTYDRKFIERWLFTEGHNTDPVSRALVTKKELTPNLQLRSKLCDLIDKEYSAMLRREEANRTAQADLDLAADWKDDDESFKTAQEMLGALDSRYGPPV